MARPQRKDWVVPTHKSSYNGTMNKNNSINRIPAPPAPKDRLAYCWSLITKGIKDRRSNYHAAYVSYIADGKPRSATMVPRKLDTNRHVLNCHTDYRSTKIQHIQKNNQVCILFWCREQKTQLRLNANVTIQHANAVTAEAWQQMQPMSRVCYSADIAPDTQTADICSGFTDQQWDERQEIANGPYGYQNFAILEMAIDCVECLDLSVNGHQRIRFQRSDDGTGDGTDAWHHHWLAP